MIRLLTLLFGLCVLTGSAQAETLENVDDYIEIIRERAAAGELEEITKVLDPDGIFPPHFHNQVAALMSHLKDSSSISTDILFRNKSTENAERTIFTIWSGHNYLHFAVIFHRRSDGWFPLDVSVNTNIEELAHYF